LRAPRSISFPRSPRLASAAAAVSGFSALVYEVVWTRLLALVIGPTTYAFATMAASFISGLAIGSAIGARLASRTDRPGPWLAGLMGIGAVAAIGAAWYAGTAMPLAVAAQVADPDASFDAVVWRQALGVGLLLLPMTVALGASFPLALALAGGEPATAARDASRVYAANTVGAITGSMAAGFVLVPLLGLRDSIRVASLLAAAAGAAVLFIAGGRNRSQLLGRSPPPRSRLSPSFSCRRGTVHCWRAVPTNTRPISAGRISMVSCAQGRSSITAKAQPEPFRYET
jgi:MFS family permease